VNEESFINEKDLIKEGEDFKTEAGEKLEKIEEKNYVFTINNEVREIIKRWAAEPERISPQSIVNKI
jgi:hypothetical protein